MDKDDVGDFLKEQKMGEVFIIFSHNFIDYNEKYDYRKFSAMITPFG